MCTKSASTMAVFSLVACFVAPAYAVNKCKGPGGAVVFQDAPCAGEGGPVRIMGAGKADPNSQGAQYWRREAARQKHDAAVGDAIAQKKVAIGMEAKDVLSSWGRPSKINKTVSARGTREQWVYDRGGYKSQYVYLDNGVVSTVQSPE